MLRSMMRVEGTILSASDALIMKLPNADQAIVDIAKLRDYRLDPTHSRGRHKARVFAAVLGINKDNAEILCATLLRIALTGEATVAERDAYGQRYVIFL